MMSHFKNKLKQRHSPITPSFGPEPHDSKLAMWYATHPLPERPNNGMQRRAWTELPAGAAAQCTIPAQGGWVPRSGSEDVNELEAKPSTGVLEAIPSIGYETRPRAGTGIGMETGKAAGKVRMGLKRANTVSMPARKPLPIPEDEYHWPCPPRLAHLDRPAQHLESSASLPLKRSNAVRWKEGSPRSTPSTNPPSYQQVLAQMAREEEVRMRNLEWEQMWGRDANPSATETQRVDSGSGPPPAKRVDSPARPHTHRHPFFALSNAHTLPASLPSTSTASASRPTPVLVHPQPLRHPNTVQKVVRFADALTPQAITSTLPHRPPTPAAAAIRVVDMTPTSPRTHASTPAALIPVIPAPKSTRWIQGRDKEEEIDWVEWYRVQDEGKAKAKA